MGTLKNCQFLPYLAADSFGSFYTVYDADEVSWYGLVIQSDSDSCPISLI